jgi:hypothetical protein
MVDRLLLLSHLLISIVYIILIPLALLRIYSAVARRAPNLLLGVDDAVHMIILCKNVTFLFFAFIFSCGTTHLLHIYEVFDASSSSLLLSSLLLTAASSLATALYLLLKGHYIADLVARMEISPRGQARKLAERDGEMKARGQARKLAERDGEMKARCVEWGQEHYMNDRFEKHMQDSTDRFEKQMQDNTGALNALNDRLQKQVQVNTGALSALKDEVEKWATMSAEEQFAMIETYMIAMNTSIQKATNVVETNINQVQKAVETNTNQVVTANNQHAETNRSLESILKLILAEQWHQRSGETRSSTHVAATHVAATHVAATGKKARRGSR